MIIRDFVLHTIHWNHLQIGFVLFQNFRNIILFVQNCSRNAARDLDQSSDEVRTACCIGTFGNKVLDLNLEYHLLAAL